MAPLEICATIAGLAYLYYAINHRPLCWAYYIVSALAYLPVFLQSGLYLYAVFQLLFMVAGIAGLLMWNGQPHPRSITRMSLGDHLIYHVVSLVLLLAGIRFLPVSNGVLNVLFDCFLTIYTLTTTILTTRKYLENWIYWLIVNGVGTVAAISNQLFFTAFFFVANFIFSIIGYRQWIAEMRQQSRPDER